MRPDKWERNKKGMQERMSVCKVLAGTVSPMTSSTGFFWSQVTWGVEEQHNWKRLGWGSFQSPNTSACVCVKGQYNAGSISGNRHRLSYLCQVGVDPFCECPFLHGLLLICKLEFTASLSRKTTKLNNAQCFHCILSSETFCSARFQRTGNLLLILFCNVLEDRHSK